MSWLKRGKSLFRLLLQHQEVEAELDAEVKAYYEMMVERYVEAGMPREDAYRAVRLKFEGHEQVKQKVRNVRAGAVLEATIQDFRYAARMLRKSPGFATVVVCSLAIGIGANSAIYSFIDWWLLRPLPILNPAGVVAIAPVTREVAGALNTISYPDFVDLRDHNRTFTGLVAQSYSSFGFAPDSATLPRMIVGTFVSANFFHVLGVEPAMGRGFREQEDQAAGRDPVVVLSHDLWAGQYNASPSVLGEKLSLNGIEFTIVGVAPRKFTGTDQYLSPALYVPLSMAPVLTDINNLDQRQVKWLTVKGRLKPGATIANAQADLTAIVDALQKMYPGTDRTLRLKVESQLQFQTEFSPPTTAMLLMLAILSGCVLLVACANVAGLLLSRSIVRGRDVALRIALGAGRSSLLRRLLVENLLLALTGGVAGLAIAYAGVKLFASLPPPSSDVPFRVDIHLDVRALLFTAAISILSSVLFGLVPALRATRPDLLSALKSSETAISDNTRTWGRKFLVFGQIALSLALLIVSAALVEGFRAELNQGPGFRTDDLSLMSFDPTLVHYTESQRVLFYRQVLEKTRLSAGVKSAALTSNVPLALGAPMVGVVADGYQLKPGQESVAILNSVVSDGYFETIGTPIVQGRGFLETDTADTPAVAIVNEQFARHYWPNQNPLGKRLRLRNTAGKQVRVVGVARTAKYVFIAEAPLDFLYLPMTQNQPSQMTLIAETNSPGALRQAVQSIDRNMPVFDVRSMKDLYTERAMKTPRLITDTVAWLGGMGLILAVVGLYGMLAYSVGRRTREIGIRMALGADRQQVVRQIMGQGARLEIAGLSAGLIIGIAAYKALSSTLFFRFGHLGFLPFAAVWFLLLVTMTVASYIPARRASRIDPIRALREE